MVIPSIAIGADYDGDKKSNEITAHGGSVADTTRIFIQDPVDTDIVTYATAQEIATAVLGASYDTAAELEALFDARCLESVFGDGIEADDFELSGTTLQLVGEIPHLDVAETISGNWVNTANPWADNEVADALTISGGTVDNSVIGGSTAAAITGTTIKANTSITLEGGANDTTIDAGTPSEAVTYTLPQADGISGQYIYTDGSGNLAFGDPSGSGDITAVGGVASGEAFTPDGGGNVLYFEGTSANAFEIALTGANPGEDVVVTIPAATGTLLLSDGDGSSLTSVDAATGDSATAFFDAGAIETNYGGTGTDLSAVTGIMGMNAGSYVDIDTAAELETYANLGAYASDILGAADSDALVTLLGLVAGDIPDLSATYEAVDAEILRADTADTISADFEWQDGIAQSFGNDNDWEVSYDEAGTDTLTWTTAATSAAAATDPMILFRVDSGTSGMTADQDVLEVQKGTTSIFNLDEDGDLTIPGTLYAGDVSGGTTAWDGIADPSGDGTVNFAGTEQTIQSSIDESGGTALTIDHTAAAITNDTYLLELQYSADGDAQGHWWRATDNNGDTKARLAIVNGKATVVAEAFSTTRTTDAQIIDIYEGTGDGDSKFTIQGIALSGDRTINVSDYDAAFVASTAVDSSGYVYRMPSGTNPTVDAEGEYSWESDEDGIRTYDGAANRLIPTVQTYSYTIMQPDLVQAESDDIIIFHFDARWFPFGAKVLGYTISTSASSSDTYLIEEWDDEAGSTQATSESIALTTATRAEDDGTLSDGDFAADSYMNVNLDDAQDDISYAVITFSYYVKAGD